MPAKRAKSGLLTALLAAPLLWAGCEGVSERIAAETAPDASRPRSDAVSLDDESSAKRLYYQFVDDRGRVHFVERLDAVPVAWRKTMGYVELDVPPPLSPLDAQRLRASRSRRAEPRAATSGGSARVVLYSAEWCGACRKAKRHLERRGVDYDLLDVDEPENLEALVETTGGKGIPVLEVDGRVVTGFSAERYDELLRI